MNSRKIKTIVVDDESRIRRGIEKLVLSCGEEWEVTASFGDGKELLDAYRLEPFEFDVLLTDIRMPQMDGLTLIKEMKALASFSPIVISGFDDFSYLQTALREGALDYILKPIDREEFKKQLQVLKEKITAYREEQEQTEFMKKQAAKLSYLKQVEKLNEVTKGFELDVSLLDWTQDFPAGSYLLLQVAPDQASCYSRTMQKEEWNTWLLANENIMDEMLAIGKRLFWKWRGDDASFWILVCSKEYEEESVFKQEIHDFAGVLQKNVKQLTPLTNSVAISRTFTNLTLLQTITKDVRALMQYRPVFGNNQLLKQDISAKPDVEVETKNTAELQQVIQKIIHAMERMDEAELRKQVKLFADKLQMLNRSSEIEVFLQSLSIQIINYVIKFTPRLNNDLLDIQDTIRLLKNSGNIEDLRMELEQWVLTVYGQLSMVNKEKVHNQVEVAKEWIMANLKDNITIEKIAGHIYMNPTYFCEYFKNETGETILDFVTRSRINKARDLLLTTNLKIYEVSELVGYADTKYFSKLFKKHYGELPSKYKEKLKS